MAQTQGGGGLKFWGVGKQGKSEATRTSVLLNRTRDERQKAALTAPRVGSAPIVSADEWLATAAAHQASRERHGAVGNPFASPAALLKESQRQAEAADDEFDLPSVGDDDDDDDDEPRDDGAPAARAPGLYWDDPKDYGYGLYDGTTVSSGRARIIAPRDAADRDRHEEFHQQTASSATAQTDDDAAAADGREKRRRIDEKAATPRVQADDAPPKPAGRELSREEKRRIELKVLELRDELEEDEALDEAAVDARCDALRATLTAAAEGPPPSRASGSSSEEVGIAIDFDDEDDD